MVARRFTSVDRFRYSSVSEAAAGTLSLNSSIYGMMPGCVHLLQRRRSERVLLILDVIGEAYKIMP
jgi:hypothetical protein